MFIKVLSWNILASEFIKKSYYPTLNFNLLNDRNKRIKIIIDNLMKEDPDIILLQEVMVKEYYYLKKYLKKNYYFSVLTNVNWNGNEKTESGNITLYKKKHFYKKNNTNNLLYNNKIYGSYIIIQLLNDKNNKLLHLFNVHLDDLSWQTRLKQINTIRPQLEKNKYCILGGDLNQKYNKNSQIYNISNFTVSNIKNMTYYIENNMNIDNILLKNIIFVKNNMVDELNFSKKELFEKYGSDHLPVIITLEI